MAAVNRIRLNGRLLTLSNLGKVLYPDTGFTKAQVIEYYLAIAEVLVAHLADRPLTLKRYPEGVAAAWFYEKRCPDHRPPWMPVASNGYCRVEDAASLVWLANLAALELHPQLARDGQLQAPDWLVFDLDPGPPATILDCGRVALQVRELLRQMGLEVWVKTSGGSGLHCYVPLNSGADYQQTKGFARSLARLLERHAPERVTSEMRKDARPGRVFMDWSQNDPVKTTVSVYSLRARSQPTVSTPLTWSELQAKVEAGRPEALVFGPEQVRRRVAEAGDLFAEVLTRRQSLPGPR